SVDVVNLSIVDLVGGQQANAVMVMFAVIPFEESAAESLGVLDGAEAIRELGLIFAGFGEAFGEGVVVGGVRPAVRFGHAQVGEQEGGGLGFHGGSPVGVERELAGRDVMLFDRIEEQWLEQGDALGVGDLKREKPSAEDVDDHVEI